MISASLFFVTTEVCHRDAFTRKFLARYSTWLIIKMSVISSELFVVEFPEAYVLNLHCITKWFLLHGLVLRTWARGSIKPISTIRDPIGTNYLAIHNISLL